MAQAFPLPEHYRHYCCHLCGGPLDRDMEQIIDKRKVCLDCFLNWDGGMTDDRAEQAGASGAA